MGLTPLAVAGIASALLVVVIGADVSMNRTYFLEAHDGEKWAVLAEWPYRYEGSVPRPQPVAGVFEVNESDPIPFRLRIDSTYPWAYRDEYVVYVGGSEALRGVVDLPASSERSFEFTLNASQIMGRTSFAEPYAKPIGAGNTLESGSLEVRITDAQLYGTIAIREVAE